MVHTFRNWFILRVCSNVEDFNEETTFLNYNYVYTLKSVLKWFRLGNYQGQ